MRLFVAACLASLACAAHAHWDGNRPDGHAPISVMGDHVHAKGEWMLSYRYMGMTMKDQYDGESRISLDEAYALVPGMGAMNMKALPIEMQMDMHMVGGMYAISDTVTLTAMLPYVTRRMTSLSQMTMMGNSTYTEMKAETAGIGDLGVQALVKVYQGDGLRVLLNLGLGLPTGSVSESDYLPMMGMDTQLPYGMQPGSGSYEARPGVTVFGQREHWSWGGQLAGRFAIDENDQGYRLGDRNQVTGWLARNLSDSVSVSTLVRYQRRGDISGRDEDLRVSPLVNPGADSDRRQAEWGDVGLGLNWYARRGAIKGHRLAVEYLAPVWQRLDGPQLGRQGTWVFGWQKAYGG